MLERSSIYKSRFFQCYISNRSDENIQGQSIEQRRLMAIRAARMSAMRELAEQIHGLKVDSNTTVIDLMVQNDTFRGLSLIHI